VSDNRSKPTKPPRCRHHFFCELTLEFRENDYDIASTLVRHLIARTSDPNHAVLAHAHQRSEKKITKEDFASYSRLEEAESTSLRTDRAFPQPGTDQTKFPGPGHRFHGSRSISSNKRRTASHGFLSSGSPGFLQDDFFFWPETTEETLEWTANKEEHRE
jgi:hypothetical protein